MLGEALNEPIVLPRISIRSILSRKCTTLPVIRLWSCLLYISIYLFTPLLSKGKKTSNGRLIPRSKRGRSLSPILRFFRLAKAKREGRGVARLKNAKTITPVLWATILDKINGKPWPPLPPKSKMGKWRVFALRAASSLIGGDVGLLFHFILSKIVALRFSGKPGSKMEDWGSRI